MKQFFAITKKSRKIAAVLLTLALLLGSFAAIPASADSATIYAWSPARNTTVASDGTVTSTAGLFTWGAIEGEEEVEYTAPAVTVSGASATLVYGSETGLNYILHEVVTSPSSAFYNPNYVEVNLTDSSRMRFGFTAPQAGTYFVSSMINATLEEGNTVTYRAVVGDEVVASEKTITSDASSGNWGNLQVTLAQGDTLWLEAWANAAVTINIGCPTYSLIDYVDNGDETATNTYYFTDMNLNAAFGTMFNTGDAKWAYFEDGSETKAKKYWTNNPWDMKAIKVATSSTVAGGLSVTTEDFAKMKIYQAGNNYYFGNKSGNVWYRPYGSTKDSVRANAANTGIAMSFTMPVDGDLQLSKLASGATKHRVLIDGVAIAPETEGAVAGDWTSGAPGTISLTDLSAGTTVTVQMYRSSVGNLASVLGQATVTYSTAVEEPEEPEVPADVYGTVTSYLGGTIEGDDTENVKVTIDEATINWSKADAAIGRGEGYYVGINVTVPADADLENATYTRSATSSAAGGYVEGDTVKFADYKDTDTSVQLWMNIGGAELIEKYETLGMNIGGKYAFDWDADGEVDQTITLEVVPSENIVLVKDDEQVATVYGDANGDNEVTILDLIRVKKAMVQTAVIDNELNIDVKVDGVDSDDLALLRKVLLGVTTYANEGFVIE